MRKPFDVLAEELVSQNGRDDRTAIELLVAGIRSWDAGLRQRLDGEDLAAKLTSLYNYQLATLTGTE